MRKKRIVCISDARGNYANIQLTYEGNKEGTTILIDGMPYHFERIPQKVLQNKYRVDADPSYHPQSDINGYCYIIAPFSKNG